MRHLTVQLDSKLQHLVNLAPSKNIYFIQMAMDKIYNRNKFGYCKYNRQCQLRHKNTICENQQCKVSKCEKDTQKNACGTGILKDVNLVTVHINM